VCTREKQQKEREIEEAKVWIERENRFTKEGALNISLLSKYLAYRMARAVQEHERRCQFLPNPLVVHDGP
jgi:hypothetical protein